jgi:hypothetical protein
MSGVLWVDSTRFEEAAAAWWNGDSLTTTHAVVLSRVGLNASLDTGYVLYQRINDIHGWEFGYEVTREDSTWMVGREIGL